ncbi:L-threonylcarbamoyladenylate synthase [Mesoterricola silvestris]|uniref:Threonylcarbamoyl-AMP synthase n=1 Tax=Mesoterricola silvestris TaxID=2927979 RepID=A0AA48KBK3_9BACT|nr:L-threonylcarbamoyladenylate synthase [Mesoterricola silvestris]BDU72608.1 threonylcarbamoyl-AMP synthase [Mesoterricola silvestris]
MILSLHPVNPQQRHLEQVAEVLSRDGVIAYPTDTLYGLGCLVSRKKAVDRIQAMKGRDPKKPMSILCSDMEMLCRYTRHLDTPTFRILKQMFPGPYTAVLPCSREVPRHLQSKRTVGLRIPDHTFCRAIARLVGEPIITTSCNVSGEEPLTTSWEIQEALGHLLDLVVDCGDPAGLASTVVDLTGDEPVLLRQGAGPWPL